MAGRLWWLNQVAGEAAAYVGADDGIQVIAMLVEKVRRRAIVRAIGTVLTWLWFEVVSSSNGGAASERASALLSSPSTRDTGQAPPLCPWLSKHKRASPAKRSSAVGNPTRLRLQHPEWLQAPRPRDGTRRVEATGCTFYASFARTDQNHRGWHKTRLRNEIMWFAEAHFIRTTRVR